MERIPFPAKSMDPEVFIQTRATTCGIAALMMALNSLGIDVKLTAGTEGKLYRYLKPKFHSVVPVAKLAWYARAKMGKEVAMYVEKGNVDFWKYLQQNDEEMYAAQQQAYAIARESGVQIQYQQVDISLLSRLISEGRVLIAGTDLGSGVKHALFVYGESPTHFNYIDPLSGKKSLPKSEFVSLLKMDFGSWIISIK
jgi:hypothetical protein